MKNIILSLAFTILISLFTAPQALAVELPNPIPPGFDWITYYEQQESEKENTKGTYLYDGYKDVKTAFNAVAGSQFKKELKNFTVKTTQDCYDALQAVFGYISQNEVNSDLDGITASASNMLYKFENFEKFGEYFMWDFGFLFGEIYKHKEKSSGDLSKLRILDIRDYEQTGKAIKPEITIDDSYYRLTEGKDYIIKYANNKNIGKATVTVTGKGKYSGQVTKSFIILPSALVLTVNTSDFKSSGTTIKWNKQSGATGYQLYYSIDGGEYVKLKTLGDTASSYKATVFKENQKVTIKSRAYVKIENKIYYSDYSYCAFITPDSTASQKQENVVFDDWVPYNTSSLKTLLYNISKGYVVYYNGQYWASPEFATRAANSNIVYEKDISSDVETVDRYSLADIEWND